MTHSPGIFILILSTVPKLNKVEGVRQRKKNKKKQAISG